MSDEKIENPAAFPRPLSTWESCSAPQNGMTLRDWFAGLAMQGVVSQPQLLGNNDITSETVANDCYALADAMLQARSRPEGKRL